MNKWNETKVTSLLKINYPIVQAPMAGGATIPELVAAVSNAGALGSFAGGYISPSDLRTSIRTIKTLTTQPFNVNLFIPEAAQTTNEQMLKAMEAIQTACPELEIIIETAKPPYAPNFEEQLNVIIEEKVPILSFTFGVLSDAQIDQLKSHYIVTMGTATTLKEALTLEALDVDIIVAQGREAGGHRGTFIANQENDLINTETLTKSIIQQVHIPVVATGGIMNGNTASSYFKLGASGVQIGTAFLTTLESGIHPQYKALLLSRKQKKTCLTRAFSGKRARGIVNLFVQRMQNHEESILPYPIQNVLTTPMRKEAAKKNLIDFMSLFAGENAHLCQNLSATELVKRIIMEVTQSYADEVP